MTYKFPRSARSSLSEQNNAFLSTIPIFNQNSDENMLKVLILLISYSGLQALCSSMEIDYFETLFILGDERENSRNAMKSPANKWPNGIIPYQFGEEYIERDKAAVLNAMEIFRKETCIRFILKRDNHTEYIRFKKSESGCGTRVGYKTEPVDVFLAEACLKSTAAIQHELLHVMGLWHEQSRPDRDEYVDILWDNILPSNHLIECSAINFFI